MTLAGCERAWHSSAASTTANAHGGSSTTNARPVSSTAKAYGASRTTNARPAAANAHGASSTANAQAASNDGNAYALSSTANESSATRSKLGTPVPFPDPALLSRQPEPDCEFKTAEPKAEERMKLDYERQCYRHAEMIVRDRLEQLQSSVDQTIKAVKRTGPNGS